jgi:hypothetical protein
VFDFVFPEKILLGRLHRSPFPFSVDRLPFGKLCTQQQSWHLQKLAQFGSLLGKIYMMWLRLPL